MEEKVYKNLGKKIRKYRLKKRMTQEELAEQLDVNPKYIGHIERAERKPGLARLIKLAQILDIKLKDLFDFDY